ncbi:MAG: hypothetical protein M0C28_29510 [Candidatus Moduliflexus flocculans]|nr:hypothetical protein [Candidatus Moduliflexus flocculans]
MAITWFSTPVLQCADKRRVHNDINLALDDHIQFLASAVFPEDQIVLLIHRLITDIGDQLQLRGGELIENIALFQEVYDG